MYWKYVLLLREFQLRQRHHQSSASCFFEFSIKDIKLIRHDQYLQEKDRGQKAKDDFKKKIGQLPIQFFIKSRSFLIQL